PNRRVHADGQGDDDDDDHGEAAQLQGGAIPLEHEVEGGPAEAYRLAEVAVQRSRDESSVLYGPRAIEPEVGAHRRDVGLGCFRRRHDLDRVAREAHEREDDDRDDDHRDDRLDDSGDDVALHGELFAYGVTYS